MTVPEDKPAAGDVTALLLRWNAGNKEALDALMPLVADELRLVAKEHLRHERRAITLQPTALVSECYLRLIDRERVDWKSRAHFFAFAARTMRRILVDYARKRHAARRGGDEEAITLDTQVAGSDGVRSVEILALDAALDHLARLDARQCKMVELRFFAGLTVRETAEALGISEITVQRDWSSARAWLVSRLAT